MWNRHKQFLKQSFRVEAFVQTDPQWSTNDVRLLEKYGAWMEALDQAEIEPQTSAQRRFVAVCRGERDPETHYEVIWHRYTVARDEERDAERLESEAQRISDEELLREYHAAQRAVDNLDENADESVKSYVYSQLAEIEMQMELMEKARKEVEQRRAGAAKCGIDGNIDDVPW